MADKDADLKIGADTSQATAEFGKLTATAETAGARIAASMTAAGEQTKVAITGISDSLNAMQSRVTGLMGKLNSMFLGFTAILAGGAIFKGVLKATGEWDSQVLALSKSLGITTERASIMNVALNHIGLDSEVVVSASQKMAKQIFTNGEAFETLGVKVKDATGHYRPSAEVMEEVNQKLIAIKNPIAQAIAGQQVYGKGWKEIRPILKLTSDVMAESEKRARELHLIVGPEGVAQSKQYKEEMRDLNLVGRSLEVQFGNQLMPVFVKLGKFMSEEAPGMGNAFKTVLESIAFAAASAWLGLKDMGDGLGAMAAQAMALLRGDLAGFREIGRLRDEEAAKNQATYERMIAGFGKDLPAAKSSAPDMDGLNPDFGKSGAGKTDKSRMSEWEAEVADAKVYYQKVYDMREYSKEQELGYWRSILENVKVSNEERIAVTRKADALELEIMKHKAQQQRQLSAEDINEREKSALDGLKLEELKAQREVEIGRIGKTQLLALQQQYEDRRFEIQQAAQKERIKAMQNDPNMDPVALQKLLDQLADIQRQHAMNVEKLQTDAAVAVRNNWEQALNPIASGFAKTVDGIIMGTQTLRKGVANILGSIVGEFTSMCAQMLVKWGATELAKTAATQKGTALRALLEKMGLVETTAAQTAASRTTVATKSAEAAAVIPVEAGEAAAGAAKAVAGIPVVGPGLAAGAFAATMAMVMGALHSASGGFDIPAGINPLTQLHAREMVLPAQYADVIRGMASGSGGAGGGDVHLHVHATDADSVKRLFSNNKHHLASTLRELVRNGSHMSAGARF